jgi:hypothetical protein
VTFHEGVLRSADVRSLRRYHLGVNFSVSLVLPLAPTVYQSLYGQGYSRICRGHLFSVLSLLERIAFEVHGHAHSSRGRRFGYFRHIQPRTGCFVEGVLQSCGCWMNCYSAARCRGELCGRRGHSKGTSRNGLGPLQGEIRRDSGCAVQSSSMESSQT